jgi:hypothetical protein
MIGTLRTPRLALFGANLARRFEAVHHRHLAIHQDQVVAPAARRGHRCAPS